MTNFNKKKIMLKEMNDPTLRNALLGMMLAVFTKGICVQSADFTPPPAQNITVCQGESAILRCDIDSEVTHKAWLNRSNILFTGSDKWSLDPRVTIINNNKSEFSIQIERVTVHDEGPYTCSYQARNEPRTAHVYLIVQVPAKIVNISADISVNEGSNVNLFCLAVGRPEPAVTWRHLKYGFMSEGEFLDITDIKRQQAEEYECITNNGVSTPDTRKVKVIVNYPPVISDAKNMPGEVGKTAILRCEAMAVPTASFEWYKDDKRLLERSHGLKIQNEKTRSLLMFTNVTAQHFGNYTCFAANKLGTSNSSMLLFRPGAVGGGSPSSGQGAPMMLWVLCSALLPLFLMKI
ncbi:igLON family member 5-like [Polyodon spathula]|uniref:igLON family member 5-like n=1 Tax=Polyodon spathula TaxID=7913 RepID=UPI001B7E5839|nr:igLON family member 5-like [Polyodon spathula]